MSDVTQRLDEMQQRQEIAARARKSTDTASAQYVDDHAALLAFARHVQSLAEEANADSIDMPRCVRIAADRYLGSAS